MENTRRLFFKILDVFGFCAPSLHLMYVRLVLKNTAGETFVPSDPGFGETQQRKPRKINHFSPHLCEHRTAPHRTAQLSYLLVLVPFSISATQRVRSIVPLLHALLSSSLPQALHAFFTISLVCMDHHVYKRIC
jgi:hypothetical protein